MIISQVKQTAKRRSVNALTCVFHRKELVVAHVDLHCAQLTEYCKLYIYDIISA